VIINVDKIAELIKTFINFYLRLDFFGGQRILLFDVIAKNPITILDRLTNDGGFIIAWMSPDQQGGSDIYAKRYNSLGQPIPWGAPPSVIIQYLNFLRRIIKRFIL